MLGARTALLRTFRLRRRPRRGGLDLGALGWRSWWRLCAHLWMLFGGTLGRRSVRRRSVTSRLGGGLRGLVCSHLFRCWGRLLVHCSCCALVRGRRGPL